MTEVLHEERTYGSPNAARKSNLIGVHCSPKLVDGIDEFIKDQYDLMKRPEAIRKILTEYLGGKGYLLKAAGDPSVVRSAD